MTKREEEMKKKQSEMNSVLEKIKILEEENQILDELNKELEEAVDLEVEKSSDLQQKNDTLQEQIHNLKENMKQYQEKVEILHDEKQNLQIESSKIDEHKEEYSNLYQQFNKAVTEKNDKVKEKMAYKLHGRDSFWDMLKWRMYFKAVPEDLVLNLNMENFDTLKTLFLANDKLDIIQENLITNFLTNENLKDENMTLYGTSKDLFFQLNLFQNYVNIVREQFLLF